MGNCPHSFAHLFLKQTNVQTEEVNKPHQHIEAELNRDLGLVSALAIGVGTMIAAGIFTLSGLAIRNVGSAAIVSFLAAAVVALFTALTYCEFVSIYPHSGEGYLYSRKTFPRPLAYVVGWALFLGYTSSCAFYIASFSSYFHEFVWHSGYSFLAGVAVVILLTMLNVKGTKESGSFQVVITLAKVALLIWFIAGGMSSVSMPDLISKFSHDIVKIGSTATLVFITFFGFSAIAASAGEVRNPVKTIPRAIFISMGLVTVLYILVVLVVIGAHLTEYTEASMGVAAEKFLGPIGGMVIVGGALFSMVSASNASIMAGSRVTMSMSQLGHLPKRVGSVSARTRTPVVALVIVGATILFFALAMPLEDLAHYADTVLLLVLVLVNAALIVHRKKFPDMVRPFRVPLVPFIPALGIIANIYLLSQIMHHPFPVVMAVLSLVVGFIGFMIWKGAQPAEEALPGVPSRVAMEKRAPVEKTGFRVLVPVANPENVEQLIKLAAAMARERNGDIIALRVVLVPEQLEPTEADAYVERERAILDKALHHATLEGVPLTSLVRIGHNAAKAILETARERDCDLVLMGWKGFTKTARKILGEVTDDVVKHAPCDIMLAKIVGDKPIARLLMPTAGGKHIQRAEEYAAMITPSKEGSLTVCSVVPKSANSEQLEVTNSRINEAVDRISGHKQITVNSKLISHNVVADGIISESKSYDAIVLGATRQLFYHQLMFGNIPEIIARKSKRSVLLVKKYSRARSLFRVIMES